MGEAAVGVTEVWTPCRESRIQLMKLHSQTTPLDLGPQDWDKLADSTEGYSGSDLATLTLGALFQPIRDMQQAVHWRQLAGRLCASGEHVNMLVLRHGGHIHHDDASSWLYPY